MRTDNRPEYISARLSEWYEQPGKPTQNAYVKRFNGLFRRELLDARLVRSLAHVR